MVQQRLNDVLPSHCIGKYRTCILGGEEDSSCEVRSIIIGAETGGAMGSASARRWQDANTRRSNFEVKSWDARAGGLCVCTRSRALFFPSSKTEDEEELATRLLGGSR